ncbi:MAG: GNAT family N-acetyltransferase [Nocardioidaceae bacterium]
MADVKDMPDERRYVIEVDGARAGFLDYALRGDTLVARHTEIDSAYDGQGLGSALVRHVLDHVRDTGMWVRPICPFVASYIEAHPDYQDLVDRTESTDDTDCGSS